MFSISALTAANAGEQKEELHIMGTVAVYSHQRIGAVDCLVPTQDDGREQLASLKIGKELEVNIHSPRNPRHHNLLFVLWKKLHDGGVFDGDADAFLIWAKYAAGHVELIVDHLANVHYVPKSISFTAMTQDQFSRFFSRVCYHVFTRLLGEEGDGWTDLRDEIIETLDQGHEEMRR